ncbi:unnamed protein product [Caretta caretta]
MDLPGLPVEQDTEELLGLLPADWPDLPKMTDTGKTLTAQPHLVRLQLCPKPPQQHPVPLPPLPRPRQHPQPANQRVLRLLGVQAPAGHRQTNQPAAPPPEELGKALPNQGPLQAHGSDQGDTKISYRVTAKNPSVTSGGKPCSTAPKTPAGADPCRRGSQSSHSRANTTGQGKASKFPSLLTIEDVVKVERETRGQRDNPKWYEWQENRITASVTPRIANSKFVNGKSSEVPQSYLKAVVSSGSKVQTPAISWGTRNEKKAVQAYKELQSRRNGRPVKVEVCGLFIHQGKQWLAASPDGIVREADTGKLLEVKCPYKVYHGLQLNDMLNLYSELIQYFVQDDPLRKIEKGSYLEGEKMNLIKL